MSKVDELNNHRETLKTFMTQPRVDREVLKQVFNIIRHTYEYELRHPDRYRPRERERVEPPLNEDRPPPLVPMGTGGSSIAEFMAAMMGTSKKMSAKAI